MRPDLAAMAAEARSLYLDLARLGDVQGRMLALRLMARISALRVRRAGP